MQLAAIVRKVDQKLPIALSRAIAAPLLARLRGVQIGEAKVRPTRGKRKSEKPRCTLENIVAR